MLMGMFVFADTPGDERELGCGARLPEVDHFFGALTPHANVIQAHHSYPILSPLSTHGKQATYRPDA